MKTNPSEVEEINRARLLELMRDSDQEWAVDQILDLFTKAVAKEKKELIEKIILKVNVMQGFSYNRQSIGTIKDILNMLEALKESKDE